MKSNSTKFLEKCLHDELDVDNIEFGFVWENLVIKSERKEIATEEE